MSRSVRLLAVAIALAAGAAATTTTQKIIPKVRCVCRLDDATGYAQFSYKNTNPTALTLPVGAQNYMVPGALDRGQPTLFAAGGGDDDGYVLAHALRFDCAATPDGVAWIVQAGGVATLKSATAPCVQKACAGSCLPAEPEWRQIGPLRGDSVTESAVAFSEPQTLREIDGPNRGVLVGVGGATLRVSTKSASSSSWYASSQQTLKSTKRESVKSLSPQVLIS